MRVLNPNGNGTASTTGTTAPVFLWDNDRAKSAMRWGFALIVTGTFVAGSMLGYLAGRTRRSP